MRAGLGVSCVQGWVCSVCRVRCVVCAGLGL